MGAEAKSDKYKQQTTAQWNYTPCDSDDFLSAIDKDSLAYFDEIRRSRYEVTDAWMPRLIPFAAAIGRRLLHIGHGIGTDLLVFAEADAMVYGVDLTEEHHGLAKRNFELHGRQVDLRLVDTVSLDFPDASFDMASSFGELHHTPDTVMCILEDCRALKPGCQFILGIHRLYSAFHLAVKTLVDGIMATVERGADGTHKAAGQVLTRLPAAPHDGRLHQRRDGEQMSNFRGSAVDTVHDSPRGADEAMRYAA